MSKHPFSIDGPVEIIAHRGYSARAPENTLIALKLGLIAGADALEFDLHTAKDGTPVLMHDETLDRTTDSTGPVASRLPAALRTMDAGRWFEPVFAAEPVPTLAEAFEGVAARSRRLYPEVKRTGRPEDLFEVVRVAKAADAFDHSVFISMDWTALDTIREADARAAIGYIVEDARRAAGAIERATGDARALIDFDARILQADPSLAATCRDQGIELACWTVNSVPQAQELLDLGVPRITTNEVSALAAWKRALSA